MRPIIEEEQGILNKQNTSDRFYICERQLRWFFHSFVWRNIVCLQSISLLMWYAKCVAELNQCSSRLINCGHRIMKSCKKQSTLRKYLSNEILLTIMKLEWPFESISTLLSPICVKLHVYQTRIDQKWRTWKIPKRK